MDKIKFEKGFLTMERKDNPELYDLLKASAAPYYSDAYLEWVKQAKLPPLTNPQFKFAEFLLKPENVKEMQKIGDLNTIFESVRRWVKKFPEVLEKK